jgi:hypothetical protein
MASEMFSIEHQARLSPAMAVLAYDGKMGDPAGEVVVRAR